MSNDLDPDQHQCSFGPDLGPNCLRQNLPLATKELSIEMQNFSFMMKIARLLFFLIGDIKMQCFHHTGEAKNLNFNSYIHILYYQSNMTNNLTPRTVCYPHKMFIVLETGMLEQPASGTLVHGTTSNKFLSK